MRSAIGLLTAQNARAMKFCRASTTRTSEPETRPAGAAVTSPRKIHGCPARALVAPFCEMVTASDMRPSSHAQAAIARHSTTRAHTDSVRNRMGHAFLSTDALRRRFGGGGSAAWGSRRTQGGADA